jgi:hypothetical protein
MLALFKYHGRTGYPPVRRRSEKQSRGNYQRNKYNSRGQKSALKRIRAQRYSRDKRQNSKNAGYSEARNKHFENQQAQTDEQKNKSQQTPAGNIFGNHMFHLPDLYILLYHKTDT